MLGWSERCVVAEIAQAAADLQAEVLAAIVHIGHAERDHRRGKEIVGLSFSSTETRRPLTASLQLGKIDRPVAGQRESNRSMVASPVDLRRNTQGSP